MNLDFFLQLPIETILFIIITNTLVFIGLFGIFKKAGYKAWQSLIPFLNLYIIAKIINKHWIWAILVIIPWIGLIWVVWATNLLRKHFQKNWLWTIGICLFPFIFLPILGFDASKYAKELNG